MKEGPEHVDPALVAGLREHELLTLLEPEELVDATAATELATSLTALFDHGLLDELGHGDGPLASISLSRLGWEAEPELIEPIVGELRSRGLADHSEDDVSIAIDRDLRNIVLTLLSQILRRRGAERGLNLAPATDEPRLHRALTEVLDAPSLPSAGHVLSFDAQAVGVDLSAVGIDEILEFREEHGSEFRAYAAGLRGAVAELGSTEDAETRHTLLSERRAGLTESADALASLSASYWRRPATFMLGLGGAAWAVLASDPLGALVSVSALAIEALPDSRPQPDAFSYICRAANL